MTSRIDIIASNGNDGFHYESIADKTALDSQNSTENGFREEKAVHENHIPDTSNMIDQSEQHPKPPEPKLRFTPEGFAMTDHTEQHIDMVNSPPHYQLRPGYEVYDLRQDLARKANNISLPHDLYSDWDRAIEYLIRCWEKNDIEDIKKARWYLNKLIEKLEADEDAATR